jgi:hypothetical protein
LRNDQILFNFRKTKEPKMKFKSAVYAIALALSGIMTAPAASAATIIDTTSNPIGNFSCLGTSNSCGNTFGQVFTVGADTTLDRFAFTLMPVIGGSIATVLRIFEWDVSARERTGSQLFASDTTTLTHTANALVPWDVGIELMNGAQYIAYVDTSGLGNTNSQSTGFRIVDGATYSGGEMFWEHTANSDFWNATSRDVSFRAEFGTAAPVPLPASGLLVIAGLGALGMYRRKPRA